MNTLINLAIDGMKVLKKQYDKKDEIRQHGVDLTNFENLGDQHLIKIIAEVLHCEVNDVEWWLFENVEKTYFVTKSGGSKSEIDVSTAEKFADYYLNRVKAIVL